MRWHKRVVLIPESTGIRITSQLPFPTGWRAEEARASDGDPSNARLHVVFSFLDE
jgi:hypothetical protein